MIPAKGFWEWNKSKEKFSFERTDSQVLFMAGCYDCIDGQDRFVILTTEANSSVKPVHDRMPLILERNELTSLDGGEDLYFLPADLEFLDMTDKRAEGILGEWSDESGNTYKFDEDKSMEIGGESGKTEGTYAFSGSWYRAVLLNMNLL